MNSAYQLRYKPSPGVVDIVAYFGHLCTISCSHPRRRTKAGKGKLVRRVLISNHSNNAKRRTNNVRRLIFESTQIDLKS